MATVARKLARLIGAVLVFVVVFVAGMLTLLWVFDLTGFHGWGS